jgi:hypothetical protein
MKNLLREILGDKTRKIKSFEEEKENLLVQLHKLKEIEAKLWGVTLKHLENGEEHILEQSNHLIYLISHGKINTLIKILEDKNYKEFKKDLKNLRNDFKYLIKEIKIKDNLQNSIANFTIKLVDHNIYSKLEEIFLLEKQLYDVVELQDIELKKLIKDYSKLKIDTINKKEVFMASLKDLRRILAGHLDHHELWNEEKMGFSNTSNILNSLIKIVKNITLND